MDTGKLDIRLTCVAGRVARVAIANTRPQVAGVLHGLPAAQATALVPRLFALCGRAQGAAAEAARYAAEGAGLSRRVDRRVAAEAAQEHLWRLLVDWPRELGLTPLAAAFARWRRTLAGDPQSLNGAPFLDFLGEDLLGMAPEAWLGMNSREHFRDWHFASPALAALICRQLADDGEGEAVLPTVAPLQAFDSFSAGTGWPALSRAFSEQPVWHGLPAETGAYARRTGDPLIGALSPQPLLARVAARLRELAALALNDCAQPLPGALTALPLGRDRGGSLVETARGLLMHELTLEGGKVARYVIVAPTEWNFHPDGPLPALLTGQNCATALQAAMRARRGVLALDPCVANGISVDWQGG